MPPRFAVRPHPATVVMQFNSYLRHHASVAAVRIAIMMAWTLSMCLSFSPHPQPQLVMMFYTLPSNAIQPRRNITPLSLFREFISDDDEDLRADIAAIREQAGFDEFLKLDERICVIK